jgi:predicted alternative tryptophan synthase beta-subunit
VGNGSNFAGIPYPFLRENLKKWQTHPSRQVILFILSGHGNFDTAAYESYLSGKLKDFEYPAEAVKESMSKLPQVKLPV